MKKLSNYVVKGTLIGLLVIAGNSSAVSAKINPEFTIEDFIEATSMIAHGPRAKDVRVVVGKVKVTMTAYNSVVEQTDSTPCIAASGFDLCEANEENVVAANFLPLGTQIRIPKKFGNRVFTVQDRMHPRFGDRVDIWFREVQDAKAFGVRQMEIEILGPRYLVLGQ